MTAENEPADDDKQPVKATEPPNSTVDDWLGQQVNRDEDEIDRLLEETDGDEAEAERRFRSHEDRPDRLPHRAAPYLTTSPAAGRRSIEGSRPDD